MPSPICKGRMIRTDIRKSKKFASLSMQSQVLFTLIIPHLNTYGKMIGQPENIKGECCPLIAHLTIQKIKKCMAEISQKTNMKWFEIDGLWYIHALNWKEHQEIRKDHAGKDYLPSYKEPNSCSSPVVVPLQVEVEVEVKEEVEVEVEVESCGKVQSTPPPPLAETNVLTFPVIGPEKEWHLAASKLEEYEKSFPNLDVLGECRHARQWCIDNPSNRKTFKGMTAFLSRWLIKETDSPRKGVHNDRNGNTNRVVGEANYKPGKYESLRNPKGVPKLQSA